jgi:superfamily I DNA and/or RNA helicase
MSVLEHLLGDAQTVDAVHGVFLGESHRLHPDVCAFVSELMYDGRLRSYTDSDGATHPLQPEDILVLTPYNAQVRCLQDRLPAGVRIGTVDKFQGQQAQIAFFSMATSSGDQIPRNVEFLFSRNRLNVAISRARCLAVLVCNPRLLDIHATSIEQMRLVNALCRFAEVAEDQPEEDLQANSRRAP